jgi:hypothetical protein
MEKEFLLYEQSLALKELGFDEPCFAYYKDMKGEKVLLYDSMDFDGECNVPLYQQAFRWFREKHNLVFNFISYNIVKPGEYHWSITWNDEAKAGGIVKTYEEAESACLDKLIEICKAKTNEQAN